MMSLKASFPNPTICQHIWFPFVLFALYIIVTWFILSWNDEMTILIVVFFRGFSQEQSCWFTGLEEGAQILLPPLQFSPDRKWWVYWAHGVQSQGWEVANSLPLLQLQSCDWWWCWIRSPHTVPCHRWKTHLQQVLLHLPGWSYPSAAPEEMFEGRTWLPRRF